MSLNKKFIFFEEHFLFNSNDCDRITYYSPEKKAFEYHSYEYEDTGDLIPTPYSDEHRGLTWRFFWESLSEEESELAQSISGSGFFASMRENGLDERFQEAENRMKMQIIEEWEQKHRLSIDYDTVPVVDCDN